MEKYFPMNGMTCLEYLEYINKWLEQNSNITPVRLSVGEFTDSCSEDKRENFELTIVYETGSEENTVYALSYYHRFGAIKVGLDAMREFWQDLNPHAQIVLCSFMHSVNRQGECIEDSFGESVPNCNCLWILYKKCDGITELTPEEFYAQNTAEDVITPLPSELAEETEPLQVEYLEDCYCAFCGSKAEEADAVFCAECGRRLIR